MLNHLILIFSKNIISNNSSFHMKPVKPSEIENLVLKRDKKSSTDFHELNFSFVQNIILSISSILSLLYNKCIDNYVYPDILKSSKVIVLYKKGDKTNCSNYRPISLISQFSKIFEKILQSRFFPF